MKKINLLSIMMTVVMLVCISAIPAFATENSRTLTLPNSYGTLKSYAWIQSKADKDGSGLYKAYSQYSGSKSVSGNKISVSCDFYIKGFNASLSWYVGVTSNGPRTSANGGSWSKTSSKYVETPYGARVYGQGLWWYIGYVSYADMSAWGKNYQTSCKI